MSLSHEEVRREVRVFLLKEFFSGEDPSVLADETPLFAQNILDSISVLQFVVFLEKRFKIKLSGQDLSRRHLDTIASTAELVLSKAA